MVTALDGEPGPPLRPVTLTARTAMLVPMAPAHAEPLYVTAREPGVWTYMPARMESLDDMRQCIAAGLAARDRGIELPFTIVDRETERPVGSTRLLDYDRANRGIEIGWTWLAPSVQRTRMNTECKLLLLTHCFEELGAIRVQLKTDLRNVRSQNAIERLGAVREGVLRHHRILPDGYRRDTVYFSILEAEWPVVRSRLKDMLR